MDAQAKWLDEFTHVISQPHSNLVLSEKLAEVTDKIQRATRDGPTNPPNAQQMEAIDTLAHAFARSSWLENQYLEFVGLLRRGHVATADIRGLIRMYKLIRNSRPLMDGQKPA